MDCHASDAAYVRLLINDISEDDPMFTETDVLSFLTHERGPKRAAARALLTIAGNELLLSKNITTQDLSTDGPAVAAELRAQAAQLRADADEDDTEGETGWGMAIVPGEPFRHRPELSGRPWGAW